jgi:predicted AlkP superfamily phosphohydrolase/phosphomutase
MNRVLLLGLDGATFSVLDPLMDAGVMPALESLCSRGARALLLSTPNPLTPSAWTSMTTGRSPGNHGVFDFVRVEQSGPHPSFRLATSSDIRCPTLFSILGRHELTTISLNFPVMFPPKPEMGFMIPGFVPHRHLRQATNPRSFYERLKKIPGLKLDEITVDFEEERRSVQVLERHEYEGWIEFHIRRERHWWRILDHLMTTEPWALSAVVFDGVDKLQHACWRFLDPALYDEASASAWERRVRELCLDYFREIDDIIGKLLDLLDDGDQVFVASDHGFGATDEILYINTWLSEHGYLTWTEDAPLAKDGMLNTEGMKTPAFLFDWSKTRAFALTPGSNGIYLHVDDPAERRRLADEIAEGLLSVSNPITGERVVRRVMKRESAFPGSASDQSPDLTLVLRDYGFVSVLRSQEVVRPRPEVVGAHHPDGIFVAAGAGVRRGVTVDRLSILDVTPAMMHGLGQAIPREFEGRLPREIYTPEYLEARPTDLETAAVLGEVQPPAAETGPAYYDAEGEKALMERLRALGYLE